MSYDIPNYNQLVFYDIPNDSVLFIYDIYNNIQLIFYDMPNGFLLIYDIPDDFCCFSNDTNDINIIICPTYHIS